VIRKKDEEPAEDSQENTAPARPEKIEDDTDELDLDLEEIGDGDRLKEGFTGQER
jgi:hypothetical protein